jgi:ABC-type hemin transport system ATPase subunit
LESGIIWSISRKSFFSSPRTRPILPERENREIIDDHLQLASRVKAADKIITQISVGMQRRVAVARAGGELNCPRSQPPPAPARLP